MAGFPAMPMKKPGATLGAVKADAEVSSGGVFDEYADDAMAALKSGDKAGFRSALKAAVKACYESEEE